MARAQERREVGRVAALDEVNALGQEAGKPEPQAKSPQQCAPPQEAQAVQRQRDDIAGKETEYVDVGHFFIIAIAALGEGDAWPLTSGSSSVEPYTGSASRP